MKQLKLSLTLWKRQEWYLAWKTVGLTPVPVNVICAGLKKQSSTYNAYEI